MSIQDFTTVLEIDPNHINAAYSRGACENKRGNFDKAIEDYHMALEKDKEKPSSPNQRLSSMTRISQYKKTISEPNEEEQTEREREYRTFENTEKSHFSESPMIVNRDLEYGGTNKNVLLSPGGQYNNIRNFKLISNSATPPTLLKQSSLPTDPLNPLSRLSKESSISSNISHLQNTPHEVQAHFNSCSKSNMSTPTLSNSPSHPSHYKQLKKEAEELHSHGYAARKSGDYQKAIMYYTNALEVLPTHFKALFNRGFAYDKIGDYDRAILDYTKAIEIDPMNAFTYYNKGISLDRKGEYDEAVWFFSKAIELEPKKADFYHNRGFAYRKKKEYALAIDDYSSAIEINSTHFKAFYNRAFCWDKLGNLANAESDYISSVELQPNNISALHHLGTVREKIGGDRLSLALENFNKVLTLNPNYSPSYNGRGLVWDRFLSLTSTPSLLPVHVQSMSNNTLFSTAIKDFSSAIALDSTNAVYWHNRA